MKISDQWLRKYIKTDLPAEEVGDILTDLGLEVEGLDTYESVKGGLKGVVVGKVLTCQQHPNADRLRVTTVEVGAEEPLHIVCGAPNVAAGQTVPVATIGTEIHLNDGSSFVIKKSKLRGEPSEGMICAEDELGLGQSHEGIMVLPEDWKIGAPLSEYIPVYSDQVYEIGLTPNRCDAMSHFGVARDLNAFLEVHKIAHQYFPFHAEAVVGQGSHDFKLVLEDTQLAPRYLGAVIEGVKVTESPDWLKNALKAIGLGSINNVVDITNYVLHSVGQPLHAFDADRIQGHTVRVGTCPEGTAFKSLDGEERKLLGSEIMIKDGDNTPMCIAGVFGGADSGVSETTQNIFLESAYFNPVAVRKAAKAHGLNTDASFRFERGIDPALTKDALNMAIALIQELAGGTLKGEILESYPEKLEDFAVTLRWGKLNQILGIEIPRETVKEILNQLEIKTVSENEDQLDLLVPAYRADVTREVDLVEEIIRVYGYNKVDTQNKIAFTPVKLNHDNQDTLESYWARALQANGFHEVMNNSLGMLREGANVVTLLNPLSNELSSLRQSLLDGLLRNADYNIKRKNENLKFYEFGKIYFKKDQYEERKQAALLVTGNDHEENWQLPTSSTDFFKLKGYVQLLMQKLGLEVEEKAWEDSRFSDGIVLSSAGKELARVGVVSKVVLKNADIDQPVFYAEIELETCEALRQKGNFKFKELPKFNTLRRDLALLVDKEVSYYDLYAVAAKSSGLIHKISLFDVYEGKNLPEGKKSYAMSLELLDTTKTLKEDEINAVVNKVVKKYKEKFAAELRS